MQFTLLILVHFLCRKQHRSEFSVLHAFAGPQGRLLILGYCRGLYLGVN